MLFFLGFDVILGGKNVLIKTELWNEIVFLEPIWRFESGVWINGLSISEFVRKLLLRCLIGILSGGDILILASEIWDEVVDLPGRVLPRRSADLFMPWNSTFWWSEANFNALY